jgi:tRNA(fMet)-specific endonuclease VapC
MICLDTNAIIDALNNPTSPVHSRIDQARENGTPLAISVIVLFELWYGAAKSGHRRRNTERLVDFLAGPIRILNFDAEDAREAGDIRAALATAGTPIGPYDILIAAQARRRGATLVTANAREFARVPGCFAFRCSFQVASLLSR